MLEDTPGLQEVDAPEAMNNRKLDKQIEMSDFSDGFLEAFNVCFDSFTVADDQIGLSF